MQKNVILTMAITLLISSTVCTKSMNDSELVQKEYAINLSNSGETSLSSTLDKKVIQVPMNQPTKKVTEKTSSKTQKKVTKKSKHKKVTLDQLRKSCKKVNGACAVAYLGFVEKETSTAVSKYINKCEIAKQYKFLKSIKKDQIVLAGGGELYCIIPCNKTDAIKIYDVSFANNGEAVIGDSIYEGVGKPVIIACNVSDIMPNTLVTVTNKKINLEYSPCLSLKDGTLATPSEAPYIYDFSKYSTEK